MLLTLEASRRAGSDVYIRLTALNDSYEPLTIDRRLLVGPNGVAGEVWPVALEPAQGTDAENLILLRPWCLYGRERRYTVAGQVTFYGYLLNRTVRGLLPTGPADSSALAAKAEPLVVNS